MLTLNLPAAPAPITVTEKQVLLVTNADLRESANVECWPVQAKFEVRLEEAANAPTCTRVTRATALSAASAKAASCLPALILTRR